VDLAVELNRTTDLVKFKSHKNEIRFECKKETSYFFQAVAHELAHNLNAKHDTESIGCAAEEHFIMSAVGGAFSRNNQLFSPCSIQSFKDHLMNTDRTAASKKARCLVNRAPNMPLVESTADRLPGQNWNPDEQCQQVFGQQITWFSKGTYLYAIR